MNLRSGIGVVLGVVFLSEILELETFAGICLAITDLVLINWTGKPRAKEGPAAHKEAS